MWEPLDSVNTRSGAGMKASSFFRLVHTSVTWCGGGGDNSDIQTINHGHQALRTTASPNHQPKEEGTAALA